MIRKGLPAEKIIDTGFPVHPGVLRSCTPVAADDACDPFRILYFPTAKLPFVRRHGRALLDASPAGPPHHRARAQCPPLYSRAREIKDAYPGRVRLIGWTRKVPQLLNSHHLVVGKAGGATVHEAIAARCPMLIHHLVPGQEEGNLRLLEVIGGGDLADTPAALTRQRRRPARRPRRRLAHHEKRPRPPRPQRRCHHRRQLHPEQIGDRDRDRGSIFLHHHQLSTITSP